MQDRELFVDGCRVDQYISYVHKEAVATSPCQRDVYAAMLVGTELSHAAYDVPKKFTGEYVLSALRKHVKDQLLSGSA
eukprot:s5577_g1.t1